MGEKTDEIIRGRSVQHETGFSPEHPGLSDTERLHAEIERTRIEMSRTLDEIKAQISPPYLRERAKARMKEAGLGRARHMRESVADKIKENPVPIALAGVGAFWLARRRARKAEREYEFEYGEPRTYYGREYETPSFGIEEEEMMGRAEREGVGVETAREKAEQMGEEMRERAARAKERVSHYGERAREKAFRQKEKAKSGFSQMLEERPLLMTTVAVAAGAIIASLIPESRKEHELMGEPKEKWTEKLKEKGQETFEKAKTVAKETAEHAKEETKKEM